nr:cellulose binding domain-containing protein [Eubacterium sp.]
MKKRGMRRVACMLILAILVCNLGVSAGNTNAQEVETESIEQTQESVDTSEWDFDEAGDEIELSYQVTSQWEEHCNVDVTLKNVTDERIDNWEICLPANYEIENIWNAKITDEIDGEYTIHNAEWNQDIEVDGTVSFGMTVKTSEEVEFPEYVDTTGLCQMVKEDKYKIEFKKHSQWDNTFNGQIIITNQSEEKIEDWSLNLNSNFEIDQIWNATVAEEVKEEDFTFYDIENTGYNQNIAPKQSVEFGFIATCDGEPELSLTELYHVTADFDFTEAKEDEDEPEFVDEFTLDSDCFETREEYEQYLEEKGLTDDSLMELEEEEVSTFSVMRKASSATPSPTPASVECVGRDVDRENDVRATQHYLPLGNGETYLMVASGKDAKVIKRTVDNETGEKDFTTPVPFTSFGHGQTFEQFVVSNKGEKRGVEYEGEYYLLAGGATKKHARKLAIMSKSYFVDRVSNNREVKFEYWKEEQGLFRIMTGLASANKTSTKRGDIFRTDAAISSDGSTLVIWKEVQKSGENVVEISLYNMKKIWKIYKKQRNVEQNKIKNNTLKEGEKNKSLKLSFAGNKKKALRNACIGTFWEEVKSKKKSVLKPNGSFQSIDVENYIEDGKVKWRIAMTSGNEIGKMQLATITRFEVTKNKKVTGKEAGVSYKAYREHIVMKDYPGAKLELEGGHLMNSHRFDFIVMRKVGMDLSNNKVKMLRNQYFSTINLLDIKTRVK